MKLFKIEKLDWETSKKMIMEIDENKIGVNSFLNLEQLGPTA